MLFYKKGLCFLLIIFINIGKVCLGATGLSRGTLSEEKLPSTIVRNANFSQRNQLTLNSTNLFVYDYSYEFTLNETQVIRVQASISQANVEDPVVFVVRQAKGIMSWQLPMSVGKELYYQVGRNVCPLMNYGATNASEGRQHVYVDIASESKAKIDVSFRLEFLQQYFLHIDQPLTLVTSPSEPKYVEYRFPPNLDMVFVEVRSPGNLCMTWSIQSPECPIYDLSVNVQYTGYFQTIAEKSAMTVKKSKFPNGFVLVFIVKERDNDCVSGNRIDLGRKVEKKNNGPAFPNVSKRTKTITVTVKQRITKKEYQEATFGALGIFLTFFLFSLVVSTLYVIRDWKKPKERSLMEPREGTALSSPATSNVDNHYGSISGRNSAQSPIHARTPDSIPSSSISTDTDQSFVEPDVDMLDDAESEKDVFRTKTFLYVVDLARKDHKRLRKKSKMYYWNLLTIAVFYALPVIQLVVTYQRVATVTGNEDLCYYNFMCAFPQSGLTDFNHVYSNIGFILLGFLFLGLVWRRDLLYRKAVAIDDRLEKFYGIPSHFGLFYSMGIALMMEGVLSGCYHVCPNYSNFQFDTTFMYLISWLCMLKIYQTRHPDINPNAHAAYIAFAFLVIMCVIGVLYGTWFFWLLYAIIHVLSCLVLSAQIYYMGRWKMNLGIFKRMYLALKNDLYTHFTQPMYMDRLILLAFGNVFNWSILLYGLIKQPKDFGSFLLSIFIVNLLLYTSFYIVMKLRHKERILPLPLIYIILSAVTWAAAIYFFLQHNTSWMLSPAESRDLNKPCLILDFYDDHDVWHFLSSSALFFSFMVLLTLDDDLIFTPRDKIPVF